MHLNESDWNDFYAGVKKSAGLDLHLYKQDQMRRRIINMVETKSNSGLPDFLSWIQATSDNMQWFLDRMAINVSELFRNPEKWQEMEKAVIPTLLEKSRNLKCWSAGCSYGAEAHTLAMILDAKFPGSHTIVGTDIDEAAMAQAKEGKFSESDVKSVPRELRDKYLEKSGDSWVAKSNLKKYLRFGRQNLLADRFESGFDLIMCRNVVIYFTEEAKDDLYRKFFQSLRPGGILFVGSTERIFNYKDIGFESPIAFYYQKPMQEETKWRNAS